MLQDTFKAFKTSNSCLLLKGNTCEMTISFEDFSGIIDTLRKEFIESNGTKPMPRLWPLSVNSKEATKD